jgi:hypothetical protein
MTMSTIHITNGDVAADSLRKALDQARRADVVLALRDDLAAGPLHGIDDTPQVRADFWQGVIGDSTRDFLAGLEQQADELKAVVDGTTHVVVWHGQSAADQLTLRRVCFHLREMPWACSRPICCKSACAAPRRFRCCASAGLRSNGRK